MSTIEPRTATVTIYGGDYLDRIRDLARRAEAAHDADDSVRRVGSVPEYMRLAQEHDALVEEAEKHALRVKVKALGRRKWKSLAAEHPPRDPKDIPDHRGDEKFRCRCVACMDRMVGVNEETLADVLVPLAIVEPSLSEDDLDALSDADYNQLYVTAFMLNRGRPEGPKAGLASRMSQESSETSD